MRHFLITVLGTLTGLLIFFFGLFFLLSIISAALSMHNQSARNENQVLLTLDLRESIRDHSAGKSLFSKTPASTVDIARTLRRAKSDKTVKGLFIRAGSYGLPPAMAEEINLALKDFQESDKFVITHAQGFEGTSILPYMAISTSDEIWLQGSSNFSSSGLSAEIDFLGGVFDKFGVQAEIEQFYEYKNAANRYTQDHMTDAHREATTAYITSIYDQSVTIIAENRDLETAKVNRLLENAPYLADEALEQALVDKLGHLHTALAEAKGKAGGQETTLKSLQEYGPPDASNNPVIAFIGGQGPIVPGQSENDKNPFSNRLTIGSDTIAKAFDTATKDDKVKAIIFRVSSPGGAVTASDQIQAAVTRAQEAGKPVIVSMGIYAASGGYYIAAGADKIIALPTTITGSIGVVGGKLALQDTFAKIGYNIEDVTVGGEFASAFSADRPFTPNQRTAFRRQLENIYKTFIALVSQGRALPLEQVHEIAKGRVWTGVQAKELGLIDEFGGIIQAIDIAKELASIEADQDIYLKSFPRPKSPQEQIEDLFFASAQISNDLAQLNELATLYNSPEVKALLKTRNMDQDDPSALQSDLPQIR